jgi:hypothetical protein
MAEPLSSFRLHDTQNSAKPEIAVSGLIDWFYIAQVARQKGLFASDEEYERNLYLNLMLSFNYFHLNPGVVSQYPERVASLAEELHKAIDICFSKKPESAAPAGGPPG